MRAKHRVVTVKLINSQLDMWMGSDQLGRLSLVIGCTDGIAQNWLVNKRDELAKLRAAGHITDPLVSEWVEVQQQFITEMSKGVTPTLYEQQLRDLRLKDDDGKLDPSAFIRRFNEITTRLYPPGSWAIESDRSRMLATIFDDRVQTGGDKVLWEKMQEWLWSKGQPKGMRQLDVCQKALLEAWGLLQVTRDGRNRSYGGARRNPWQRDEKKKALPLPPSSASTSHHANAVAARTNDLLLGANDDSSQSENGQLGTQELAAVAQAGRGRREGRGGRNPHLSPALVEQLRNNGLCLSCYKPGHYSRQCTATPANRPPTSDELKVEGRPEVERQLSRPDLVNHPPLATPNPFAAVSSDDDDFVHGKEEREETGNREEAVQVVTISSVKDRKVESVMPTAGEVDAIKCNDVLVDGGASASFVRREWAVRHRLPITKLKEKVTVIVADTAKHSVTEGVVVERLTVNGSTASITLLVMNELTNAVIAGLDWLIADRVHIGYGPTITWNGTPVTVRGRRQAKAQQPLTTDSASSVTVTTALATESAPSTERQQKEREFLESYRDVFSEQLPIKSDEQRRCAAQFTVELYDPECRPVKPRERKMNPMKVQAAKEWVRAELAAGRMEPSSSEWSSQIVFVKKDDSATTPLRPCGDYTSLNDRTKKDAYRLPLMEQLIDRLGEWKPTVFSKLDATKGFNQIPVHPDSRHFLAISTPDGLYQPTVMPFGVTNAPAVFQREMERVLQPFVDEGVIVFVDDILLFTATVEEHERLLERLLQRIRSEGYALHPKKCELFRNEVVFLGHRVNAEGIAVQQRKIEAVKQWPVPQSQTEVRRFLGFANFYHKFINGFASIAPSHYFDREGCSMAMGIRTAASLRTASRCVVLLRGLSTRRPLEAVHPPMRRLRLRSRSHPQSAT